MQDRGVQAFKNELRNYKHYLSRIIYFEDKIESLYDRLGGVRGVDPSKEPLHVVPNKEMEWYLRDEISRCEAKKSHYEEYIKEIDRILNQIEEFTRDALKLVYIEGKHTDVVADSMLISPSGLKNRMNRAIKKAIKKED